MKRHDQNKLISFQDREVYINKSLAKFENSTDQRQKLWIRSQTDEEKRCYEFFYQNIEAIGESFTITDCHGEKFRGTVTKVKLSPYKAPHCCLFFQVREHLALPK